MQEKVRGRSFLIVHFLCRDCVWWSTRKSLTSLFEISFDYSLVVGLGFVWLTDRLRWIRGAWSACAGTVMKTSFSCSSDYFLFVTPAEWTESSKFRHAEHSSIYLSSTLMTRLSLCTTVLLDHAAVTFLHHSRLETCFAPISRPIHLLLNSACAKSAATHYRLSCLFLNLTMKSAAYDRFHTYISINKHNH